jgi:hypothetical protein
MDMEEEKYSMSFVALAVYKHHLMTLASELNI